MSNLLKLAKRFEKFCQEESKEPKPYMEAIQLIEDIELLLPSIKKQIILLIKENVTVHWFDMPLRGLKIIKGKLMLLLDLLQKRSKTIEIEIDYNQLPDRD